MSHVVVNISYTNWIESVLVWFLFSCQQRVALLYKYMPKLLEKATKMCKVDKGPSWLLEEATFENMRAVMAENRSKLLGLYDELSTFLTQINLYKRVGAWLIHTLWHCSSNSTMIFPGQEQVWSFWPAALYTHTPPSSALCLQLMRMLIFRYYRAYKLDNWFYTT